jgi:hypothetical protein
MALGAAAQCCERGTPSVRVNAQGDESVKRRWTVVDMK